MQKPAEPATRAPSDTFAPTYELTPDIHERLRRIERFDQALCTLAHDLPGQSMLRDALSYNAYGTASIEGNPLTLQEVQSVLKQGPTPDALRTPDEREILNWAAFMQHLDAHEIPQTTHDTEHLHGILFEGVMTPERGLGTLKTVPNFIGDRQGNVVYIPTPPERVHTELQRALAWYHASTDPPLIKAWAFHLEFEAIHPFVDGNGRLGRALLTLMLHRDGYPGVRHALVDFVINRDRTDYYQALRDSQNTPEITPWIRYLSHVFDTAYQDAVTRFTVGIDADLNPRQTQVAAWLARVCLGARRVAFGDVHAAFPHINRRTLQQDLRKLVDGGFLTLQGQRKGATYGLARPSPT